MPIEMEDCLAIGCVQLSAHTYKIYSFAQIAKLGHFSPNQIATLFKAYIIETLFTLDQNKAIDKAQVSLNRFHFVYNPTDTDRPHQFLTLYMKQIHTIPTTANKKLTSR